MNVLNIDVSVFDKHFRESEFYHFLTSRFHVDDVNKVCYKYHLGATKTKGVVYWQIDLKGNVRAGKILHYDRYSGKRIKSINPQWVHKKIKDLPEDFVLNQCLFGLHLTKPFSTCCLVESEKSAVIMSLIKPSCTWVACGGKSNLNKDRIEELPCDYVLVYPDRDGVKEWKQKLWQMGYGIRSGSAKKVILFDWLKGCEHLDQLPPTADIADLELFKIDRFLNYHKKINSYGR